MEVSVLEEPGKDSLGFGRLTLGLKRAVHSNLDDPPPAALACSLSRVLRRGEGLEAERERRALVWSLPCLTRAPCVALPLLLPLLLLLATAVAVVVAVPLAVEEADEVEAEEVEESVRLLHPALAEAADLDASLVGLAVRLCRDPAAMLRSGGGSAFFRLWTRGAPEALLFLFWPRPLPDTAEDASADAGDLFLDLADPFRLSEASRPGGGGRDLGFLGGLGPKLLIWSGASLLFRLWVAAESLLFDGWPARFCSDVPATSASSCSTKDATESERALLEAQGQEEEGHVSMALTDQLL